MAYLAPEGEDRHLLHSFAISQEIGERLRFHLKMEEGEMPPHLILLMKRFAGAKLLSVEA
jgi:hypothetical protein